MGRMGKQPLLSRGVSDASQSTTKLEVAHKWGQWLHNPCHLEGPLCFTAGDNQKWPTSGPGGYMTHAVGGVPDA